MKKSLSFLLIYLLLLPFFAFADDEYVFSAGNMSFKVLHSTKTISESNDGGDFYYFYPQALDSSNNNGGIFYVVHAQLDPSDATILTLAEAKVAFDSYMESIKAGFKDYSEIKSYTFSLEAGAFLHHCVFSAAVEEIDLFNDLYLFSVGTDIYHLQFSNTSLHGEIPSQFKSLVLSSLTIKSSMSADISLPSHLLDQPDVSDVVRMNQSEYQIYDYRKIARNPYDYQGKRAEFSGKVIQVLEYGLQVNLRIKLDNEDRSVSNVIFVVYTRKDERESRILEDDRVKILGVLDGLETYTTVLNSQKSIPRIIADSIVFLGD